MNISVDSSIDLTLRKESGNVEIHQKRLRKWNHKVNKGINNENKTMEFTRTVEPYQMS